MCTVIIDLETRSVVDLRKVGIHIYTEHPCTAITHVGYKVDHQSAALWRPISGSPMPAELFAALSDPSVTLVAHNASFERVLLTSEPGRKVGMPGDAIRPISRWTCTASRAAAVGLPRALERACMAFGLPVEKDMEGRSLMLRCSRPRSTTPSGDPIWWDDEGRMSRIDAYCLRDVEAEYLLHCRLPPLAPAERQVWELTEHMNTRGVVVDRNLLDRTLKLVEQARITLDGRISNATDGAIPRVSNHAAITRWLNEHGIAVEGIGRHVVDELLRNDVDDRIRQVLEIRREGGGSSSRKHTAIQRRLAQDGRVRGELVYGGAVSTGRWSSHGVQLQNLPRGGMIDVQAVLRDLKEDATVIEIEDIHGPPLQVASELLRPMFVAPPAHWLARGDYSQIEARILAWLAGQTNIVEAFRAYDVGTGPDLYRVTAAKIYRVPIGEIDRDQRQIGKTACLALGYSGGKRAFQAMAKNYGVKVSDERAEEVKLAWRDANPYIVQLWRDLNDCAVQAVGRTTNVRLRHHGIEFRCNKRVLTLSLPSGRSLVYWRPSLKEVDTPWGDKRWAVCYFAEDSITRKWTEFTGYSGIWCENLVQATARDIMADALLRLHAEDLHPVLTVHDEAVCELPQARFPTPRDAAAAVKRVMQTAPAWTKGLPLAVDASADTRYTKG